MADVGLAFVGIEGMMANLQRLGAVAPLAVAEGLEEHAEAVMTASKTEYVPVDMGTLRASGVVLPPEVVGETVSVTMGYGGAASAYALAVHENPRSGHTGGVSPSGRHYKHWAQTGGWKYLETPFREMTPQVEGRVADAVQRAVTRLAP